MFIGRRLDGTIYGAWSVRQADDADHPLQEEVANDHPDLLAFLAPRPGIDFSDVDNVEKGLKSLGLVTATWGGKTVSQLKAAFKAAWDSLP
jgi:hypothetical protein